MTFPNSAPHPPPTGSCCFCERRPTSTSWFSPMSPSSSYYLMSSSSLYFMVCLSLTRSLARLKSPDFQDPQKTIKFAQGEKKNARNYLHGSFHAVTRSSHASKSTEADTWLMTLPYMFPSPLITFKSFLSIHFSRSLFLSNTFAALHYTDSRKVHASSLLVLLLYAMSCVILPAVFLFAFTSHENSIKTPAF